LNSRLRQTEELAEYLLLGGVRGNLKAFRRNEPFCPVMLFRVPYHLTFRETNNKLIFT